MTHPPSTHSDWPSLRDVLRSEEWQIHTECFSTALEGLRRYRENEKDAKLGDIAKLFELGSYLGRLATGLPTDKTPAPPEPAANNTTTATEVEAMLNRIYGKPLPGEAEPPPPTPPPLATPPMLSAQSMQPTLSVPKEVTHANA